MFREFEKHCTQCQRGQPCGKSHLYVMIVDPTIMEKKKFREANPDYVEGMPCFYVGKTEHVPRCRQSQHQGKQKGTWRCYCGKEGTTNTLEFWHKPSTVVKDYTEGFLKADLFRDWNPVEPEVAEEREAELAAHLRKQGYGIWAGHHDKKKS